MTENGRSMANSASRRRLSPVAIGSGALGLVALVGGCAVELDSSNLELGEKSSAFVDDIRFPIDHYCSAEERDKIRAAADVALANLNDPDMLTCLVNHGLSAARGRSAEFILAQMKQDVPTRIKCRDNLDANAGAPRGINDEMVLFKTSYLATATIEEMAGVFLHELAHNKGYTHLGLDELNGTGDLEYQFCVNEQLESCSVAISAGDYHPDYGLGDVPDARGTHVGGHKRASQLGPVGGIKGKPHDDLCETGKFASGYRGYYDDVGINSLAFTCREPDGTNSHTTTYRGDEEGSGSFVDECPSGYLLVGFMGSDDGTMRRLRGLCRDIDHIASSTDALYYMGYRGVDDGHTFKRLCPNGQAVKGIKTYSDSNAVYGLTLSCEDIDKRSAQNTYSAGMAGRAVGQEYRERCARSAVMTGIFGRAGNEVDRLGGVCDQVSDKGDYVELDGSAMPLSGRGSDEGGSAWAPDECPANQALVGLEIRSGERVNNIRGVCANVQQWSNDDPTPAQSFLVGHGGDDGTRDTYMCARNYFLHGWQLWIEEHNGTERVFGLKPHCIKPES